MDIFGKSSTVDHVIRRFDRLAKSGNYVFRGYSKQDELLPAILRDKKSYIKLESDFLKDFEKYGSNYFHATTPIDFMSYAQHFGIPTRLLDFTHNPYIALSFALYNPKGTNYIHDEDKEYFYIRYASLDDNLCAYSIKLNDDIYNSKFTRTDSLAVKACHCIDSVTDLFGKNIHNRSVKSSFDYEDIESGEKLEEKKKMRVILFIDPNQANQRIIMQQGLFMFPYTLGEEEHLKILKSNSKCIKIHKDLREELIHYLDVLGYNTFRLMPDLTSICEAVKRRNMDNLQKKKVIKTI
ncbi:MAG: FRG domain-containing protein [Clostridiaceae bacterium]|jgi:hypothetical protein|nr:FRG domain-containing protein [Clostridiaceae bacterium]